MADQLIDAETEFGANCEGLFTHTTQIIPDDFIDTLKSERHAKAAVRAAEFERVASVPTFVVELWMKQGLDFYNMSAREIVAKLNADDLGAFIATPKRV